MKVLLDFIFQSQLRAIQDNKNMNKLLPTTVVNYKSCQLLNAARYTINIKKLTSVVKFIQKYAVVLRGINPIVN